MSSRAPPLLAEFYCSVTAAGDHLLVSVLFWGVTLSRPLTVVALVGHYPTNKLMVCRLLLRRAVTPIPPLDKLSNGAYAVLIRVSPSYSPPKGRFLHVTQPFATIPPKRDRSTCMLKARRQRSSWARIKPSKSVPHSS